MTVVLAEEGLANQQKILSIFQANPQKKMTVAEISAVIDLNQSSVRNAFHQLTRRYQQNFVFEPLNRKKHYWYWRQ
jgi:Fic family protein